MLSRSCLKSWKISFAPVWILFFSQRQLKYFFEQFLLLQPLLLLLLALLFREQQCHVQLRVYVGHGDGVVRVRILLVKL
jgi:hypothetical protein